MSKEHGERPKTLRALGLGLVTGAADDDPSAIGTYASAGARLGTAFLWAAPLTLPMMFAVVYLSARLGQVSGRGLFGAMRESFPPWVLRCTLAGVLIGNTIEAGADLGGIAAALNLVIPLSRTVIVIAVTLLIFGLQTLASYRFTRNVFRWLALTLLAYVGAAVLAKPDLRDVLIGSLVPHVELSRDFLSLLVAVIGTTLSAYLYTWQSNQEVEEKISAGTTGKPPTNAELGATRRDVWTGMFFSNLIMYFIILATGSTLHDAGIHDISSAAEAAQALRPLAGRWAEVLFALGVVGVGFLAVPVMTTGAAYDLCQTVGWRHGLSLRPREARKFYAAIGAFTAIAMLMNFLGVNPMRALVWSGVVQGFSTPPLLLLILLMTNNRALMGDKVNSLAMNLLGFATLAVIFAASAGLVITWFL